MATTIESWLAQGLGVASATVVETWGSSPRPQGSVLAVAEDGRFAGSVSGGCVEGVVIESAAHAIRTGAPRMLEFAGLEPEDVWAVGLSCGGRIQVLVEAVTGSAWRSSLRLCSARQPFLFVACHERGSLSRYVLQDAGDAPPGAWWADEARMALGKRESRLVEGDDCLAFLHFVRRPERLVIVGGVHVAVPLVRLAHVLGLETILIEPRAAFASPERFPEPPSTIYAEHPSTALAKIGVDEDTYAVVLTHDPKIDDPALRVLLRSPAASIGALGSRTTQAERTARLAEEGFGAADLDRIRGPVGLSIGARTPEEIALSIMAEVVQVRRGAVALAAG